MGILHYLLVPDIIFLIFELFKRVNLAFLKDISMNI